MIFSTCPRCESKRIRRGYRHTPIWWKVIGRYHLLCDSCNWEFIGFALPGTIEMNSARRRKKRASDRKHEASAKSVEKPEKIVAVKPEKTADQVETVHSDPNNPNRIKVRKRVKIKLNK
jgi:hypothetical protein